MVSLGSSLGPTEQGSVPAHTVSRVPWALGALHSEADTQPVASGWREARRDSAGSGSSAAGQDPSRHHGPCIWPAYEKMGEKLGATLGRGARQVASDLLLLVPKTNQS